MPAFNIRNMDEEQIAGLDRLAHQAGESRQVYAANVLIEHVEQHSSPYDPDLILGYFRLDRFGDLDPTSRCHECDSDFTDAGVWLAVGGDFRISGISCEVCATSE